MEDIMRSLRAACSTDTMRYLITQPFRAGEYVYATTGALILRTHDPEGKIDAPTDGPDASRLGWDRPPRKMVEFAPGPMPEVEYRDCSECKGGGGYIKCSTCDGDGTIECSCCENERDCPDCDCEGVVVVAKGQKYTTQCEDCDGTGRGVVDGQIDTIGSWVFSRNMIRTMMEIPVTAIEESHPDQRGEPLWITWAYGDGLVMLARPRND